MDKYNCCEELVIDPELAAIDALSKLGDPPTQRRWYWDAVHNFIFPSLE
jgi:hypothetical protein